VPIYEYVCGKCNEMVEKLEFGYEMDQVHSCPKCGSDMKRIVSRNHFKLVYNNKTDFCDWQGNSSLYWKDYKAAKERGENVKPAGEED